MFSIRRFSVTLACVGLAATSAKAADNEPEGRPRAPAVPYVPPNTPSGRFGLKSQIAVSSDAGLSISNTSQTGQDGSTTTLQLHPAVDYFVMDNFSFGGFLGLDYTSNPGGHSTTFSIGPRVGYNIPISDRFSIWPKAGLSFASTSQTVDQRQIVLPNGSTSTVSSSSTNSSNLALNLFVPVMFHPVEHFFLGFGPALDVDLTGDVKTTTIAGRLTIGGWL